jgi:ABC-type amino acid transport substrate-binding protein
MWSLLYPEYSVVVPQPDIVTIPIAYAVGRNDQELLAFLNTWLDLKKKDGTITKLYDHWILGKNAERTNARWSIIRNVLHWVR